MGIYIFSHPKFLCPRRKKWVKVKKIQTRMHCSRMRTASSLIVSPYLVVSHACPPPATTHAPPPRATTHAPPVNRITHTCKNITFPQLRQRAVKSECPHHLMVSPPLKSTIHRFPTTSQNFGQKAKSNYWCDCTGAKKCACRQLNSQNQNAKNQGFLLEYPLNGKVWSEW